MIVHISEYGTSLIKIIELKKENTKTKITVNYFFTDEGEIDFYAILQNGVNITTGIHSLFDTGFHIFKFF
jgi:hypothetical protein